MSNPPEQANISAKNTTCETSHGYTLPSLGTSSQWQDISNYTEFMNSLISFLNVSHNYMNQVRKKTGRMDGCGNPVDMTDEEREQRMSGIVSKIREFHESSRANDSSGLSRFNPPLSSTRNETYIGAGSGVADISGMNISSGRMSEEQRQKRIGEIIQLLEEKYAEIQGLEEQKRNLSGDSFAEASRRNFVDSNRGVALSSYNNATCPSRFAPGKASSGPSYNYSSSNPYSTTSGISRQPNNRSYPSSGRGKINFGKSFEPASAVNRTYAVPPPKAAVPRGSNRTYQATEGPQSHLYKSSGSPCTFKPPIASSRIEGPSGVPSSYYSEDTGRWPWEHTSAYESSGAGGTNRQMADRSGAGIRPISAVSRPTTQPRTLGESSMGAGCFIDCTGTQQHRLGGFNISGVPSFSQERRTI